MHNCATLALDPSRRICAASAMRPRLVCFCPPRWPPEPLGAAQARRRLHVTEIASDLPEQMLGGRGPYGLRLKPVARRRSVREVTPHNEIVVDRVFGDL